MNPIVLLAVNARWAHTAFGARSLVANLGTLRPRAVLMERTITDRARDIVEAALLLDPAVVGIGVYIWNAAIVGEIVSLLKTLRPDLPLVLGGPEMIDPDDLPDWAERADAIIAGEAERVFPEVCQALLEGQPRGPKRFVRADPVSPESLTMPYDLYSDEDLAHRKLYVETSRGCPYGCTFCLSSLDDGVRKFPLQPFLNHLENLWNRGARHFKFIDRAIHWTSAPEILQFFLDRYEPGTFVHFELVPDHLPASVGDLLRRFPPGSIQLEAGIQTLNPKVAETIGRHQNTARIEENLAFLKRETGVHIHADLIVGLPGEDIAGFENGFDRLFAMGPDEIQVGLLKRLRGTPIARTAGERGLVFHSQPPYEIVRTDRMSFSDIQRLRRFSRLFDQVANSGHFPSTTALVGDAPSPFAAFLNLSDWLGRTAGATHQASVNRLARLLARHLVVERGLPESAVEASLAADFERAGRSPIPLALDTEPRSLRKTAAIPGRQRRRLDDSGPR